MTREGACVERQCLCFREWIDGILNTSLQSSCYHIREQRHPEERRQSRSAGPWLLLAMLNGDVNPFAGIGSRVQSMHTVVS